MLNDFLKFLIEYENKVVDLSKETNLAYFNATISGKPEDYQKASELQLKLSKVYSDKEDFERIKKFKESNELDDQVLKRQVELIYNNYASYQFNEELLKEIISLSTKVEEKFSTYRAVVNGKKMTDNEIDELLKTCTDSKELEDTWNASKQIGREVYVDVIKLVKMRNQAAAELGYDNFHQMSLKLSEQEPEELDKLFDQLNDLIENEFDVLKDRIDTELSSKYEIDKSELMPWHYQDKFFQQGPKIYKVDLDKYFKEHDLVKITRDYYNGINLSIDDLLENSDLFEKDGKYQHAYCVDIDREGDVRVLCNIKPNYKWMGTMLHEYGHAVYDKYINQDLPWQLKEPAHIFTTEAIAMLFGRFASNPNWIQDVIGITDAEKEEIKENCYNSLKLEQLVFARWVQVMYRFEREMYSNPEQDLNKLWWDLVEKYQKLKKPEGRNEPDWAAKIHVALYPAYYHNYMLGELLASQLFYYIAEKVVKSEDAESECFTGKKDVGEYLKHLFFSYGSLYKWDELINKSTGEDLNPNYYARQFVS
ncbi:MAG: M2 family metallopeptidase [Melioribacteraceae bacterium]|nr:M2 family metallopeptidase [Melioribacteraceae bacterium]MCF8354427.1 M2 family metallopeptidase [Melioribacteraceae bacterium]MCF8394037.1 M2 family metallopeptidase [Melioribacteraceae bacterium]MCF8419803.1 M2 family metallopeptidase [Melioribacteraceae bacterium]